MNVPEVGLRWKKAREECGLSVRAAAKLIGIHYNTLYDLEKGDDGATLRLMKRAADEYGVSLGFIFGMDDPRPERVPVYLRPLMEPLQPLSRSARESIVRNIASNLRFMEMLYGGAESFQGQGGNLQVPSTTISDLNKSDTLDEIEIPNHRTPPAVPRGPLGTKEPAVRRGQHRKAHR